MMDIIRDEKAIQRECGDLVMAMATVPIQPWETPFAPDTALMKGTIFPCLNLPFFMTDEWTGGVTR